MINRRTWSTFCHRSVAGQFSSTPSTTTFIDRLSCCCSCCVLLWLDQRQTIQLEMERPRSRPTGRRRGVQVDKSATATADDRVEVAQTTIHVVRHHLQCLLRAWPWTWPADASCWVHDDRQWMDASVFAFRSTRMIRTWVVGRIWKPQTGTCLMSNAPDQIVLLSQEAVELLLTVTNCPTPSTEFLHRQLLPVRDVGWIRVQLDSRTNAIEAD